MPSAAAQPRCRDTEPADGDELRRRLQSSSADGAAAPAEAKQPAERLGQNFRQRLDRSHALSKPCYRIAVTLQLSVRKESDAKIRDAAERRPRELRPHVILAVIWSNKEEPLR